MKFGASKACPDTHHRRRGQGAARKSSLRKCWSQIQPRRVERPFPQNSLTTQEEKISMTNMDQLQQHIEDFIQHCQFERHFSKHTLKAYRLDLGHFKRSLAAQGHKGELV